MAWCKAHTLLILHKANIRFISYLSIYIFIIYVKELTGYEAIDRAFLPNIDFSFCRVVRHFFEAITDISSDAESRKEQYGTSHF